MEIQLCPAKVLHALAAFSNPNDVREPLRGVWIENSRAGLILHATDNAAFAAIRLGDAAPCESFSELIPWDAVKSLPKTAAPTLTLEPDNHFRLAAEDAHVSFSWKSSGFAPMAWRRIVVKDVSHQPGQFDQALLMKFMTLAIALGRKKNAGYLRVTHNGQGTARVHIPDHPEVVGVVVPLRERAVALPEEQPFTPSWAHLDALEPALV